MAAVANEALDRAKVGIEDIALLVPHEANLEIIRDTGDVLGVAPGRVAISIDRYGNTSTASMPTALREAWDRGQVRRNDLVLFVTFGAGFNFGAAVLPMVGLPPPA